MSKIRLSLILVCLIISFVLFSCQPKPPEAPKPPEKAPETTTPIQPPAPPEKPEGTGPEQVTPPPEEQPKPGDTPGETTTPGAKPPSEPKPEEPAKPAEPPKKEPHPGLAVYNDHCVNCHKVSDKPDIPAKGQFELAGVGKKYKYDSMKEKLGKPPHDAMIKPLKEKELENLIKFLLTL